MSQNFKVGDCVWAYFDRGSIDESVFRGKVWAVYGNRGLLVNFGKGLGVTEVCCHDVFDSPLKAIEFQIVLIDQELSACPLTEEVAQEYLKEKSRLLGWLSCTENLEKLTQTLDTKIL